MSSARNLDDLMLLGRRATARVLTERDDAKAVAVAAIRSLEQRLQEMIAGDGLRGLRDLAPSACDPFQAATVAHLDGFPVHAHGVDTYLPLDARPMLVIDHDGVLTAARVVSHVVFSRPVTDDELRVEHLEGLRRALVVALERHVEKADRTAARYGRARALADRLRLAGGT